MAAGVVALALGVAASAAPAAAKHLLHLAASFHLQGSHGYSIRVFAHRAPVLDLLAKRRGPAAKVSVRVERASASESSFAGQSVTYSAPARFNKHRIRADLGRFGRIRLRFHKHPRYVLPPARSAAKRRMEVCGQSGFAVPGHFRGVFRFHGDGGYTSAIVHRVHGQMFRNGPARCHGHTRGVELEARSASIRFLAFQDPDFGATALVASTRERSGLVKIVRASERLTAANAGELTVDNGLTSAHVSPTGPPFTGWADYSSPESWTGSLAVSFPGESDVPLTGPDFSARLRSGPLVFEQAIRSALLSPGAP